MTPPHLVLDDFLDAPLHGRLLDWVVANGSRFLAATVYDASGGQAVDEGLRVARRLGDLGPAREPFEVAIRDLIPAAVAALRMTAFEPGSIELELAAHGDGAHFARHRDLPIGPGREAILRAGGKQIDRMLSCVYYFHREPKGFEGGDLRLFALGGSDDSHVDIEPRDNRLLVFPSWAPHEVRPIACSTGRFEDYRFAINCWVHRRRGEPPSGGNAL